MGEASELASAWFGWADVFESFEFAHVDLREALGDDRDRPTGCLSRRVHASTLRPVHAPAPETTQQTDGPTRPSLTRRSAPRPPRPG